MSVELGLQYHKNLKFIENVGEKRHVFLRTLHVPWIFKITTN